MSKKKYQGLSHIIGIFLIPPTIIAIVFVQFLWLKIFFGLFFIGILLFLWKKIINN